MVRRRPDGARRRARGSGARLAGDHGDLLWDDLAADDAGLAAWCAERWLGACRRLEPPPPPRCAATRVALHRLAEQVLAPARQRANGKIALRYSPAGSGRRSSATTSRSASRAPSWSSSSRRRAPRPLTSLAAAGRACRGRRSRLSRRAPGRSTRRRAASSATGTASRLRCSSSCAPRPARARAFAGAAVDRALRPRRRAGAKDAGARRGYGGSPGDERHSEPYLSWCPGRPHARRATDGTPPAIPAPSSRSPSCSGAADQRAAALEFFRGRLRALTTGYAPRTGERRAGTAGCQVGRRARASYGKLVGRSNTPRVGRGEVAPSDDPAAARSSRSCHSSWSKRPRPAARPAAGCRAGGRGSRRSRRRGPRGRS